MPCAHRPVRRWTTLWVVVGCACGYPRWRGSRCPIDDCAERIGDGQIVPLPPTPPLALVEEKRPGPPTWASDKTTWPLPVPRRRPAVAAELRANGGGWRPS